MPSIGSVCFPDDEPEIGVGERIVVLDIHAAYNASRPPVTTCIYGSVAENLRGNATRRMAGWYTWLDAGELG